jgi:pimeloyl-ACP methyl ester carboxylesterase
MQSETRYARSGDVNIAYQVLGSGPPDLVLVPGSITHLEVMREEPDYERMLRRLASFARLIVFDKRGTGLSDRAPGPGVATLETRMDDVRAVMDAAGSEHAALFGMAEGAPMSALFAATYPERVTALVLYGSWARQDTDAEEITAWEDAVPADWGTEERARRALALFAPSRLGDPDEVRWLARLTRLGASPGAAIDFFRMNDAIDVRAVLGAVHAPTLVIHRAGDRAVDVAKGREVARLIPKARYVELPGQDHFPWTGDADAVTGDIEEFVTGVRHAPDPERVLATVLFTDIVGSTERASAIGDHGWRGVLERHHRIVRSELDRFRGREVNTAGDGFLAAFDGPARGIRCACAIVEAVGGLGIQIRAGLHTGEVEVIAEDMAGIAVHTGARIAATAGPSEVIVSSIVKDLVAGSGLSFEDRGVHHLKGVMGEWHLFAVEPSSVLLAR